MQKQPKTTEGKTTAIVLHHTQADCIIIAHNKWIEALWRAPENQANIQEDDLPMLPALIELNNRLASKSTHARQKGKRKTFVINFSELQLQGIKKYLQMDITQL